MIRLEQWHHGPLRGCPVVGGCVTVPKMMHQVGIEMTSGIVQISPCHAIVPALFSSNFGQDGQEITRLSVSFGGRRKMLKRFD